MLTSIRRPSGKTFEVHQSDEVADLKIGDVVTVSCLTFAQDGTPLVPKVLRVRTDVVWKDIIGGDELKTKLANGMNTTKTNPNETKKRNENV